jgi:hypothetical protein
MGLFIKKIILYFVMCFFLFAICLQMYDPFVGDDFSGNINRTLYYKNDKIPELPGIIHKQYNNIGEFGENYSDTIKRNKIFFVGSSTTESFYLDFKESWIGRLELDKQYWVNNAGIDGASIDIMSHTIDKYLKKFQPDYIIVLLNPFNYKENNNKTSSRIDEIKLYSSIIKPYTRICYQQYQKIFKSKIMIGHQKAEWSKLERNISKTEVLKVQPGYVPKKYFDNLDEMTAAIKKIGAIPIYISDAIPFGDYTENNMDLGLIKGSIEEDYTYKDFNKMLEAYCKTKNIKFISGYSMPKSISYYYDYSHFNYKGSVEFAKFIKQDLLSCLETH